MRHGFKAWCENTAAEYRSSLGLALDVSLDPRELARHLGVEVWAPEDVPGLSGASLQQLTARDPDGWSAVTLKVVDTYLIITNSAQALTRQRNSLAHELAHLILDSRPWTH